MTTSAELSSHERDGAFSHEALLYAGEEEFLAATVPFVREGAAVGEPTLVVVGAAKLDGLRAELNGGGELVLFADMAEIGANPARIISAWQAFVAAHAVRGRAVRGIGEPIWPGRSVAELVECQRHESLLNLAFAGAPAWRLLCPYDVDALEESVIDEALRSHPAVLESGVRRESESYRGLDAIAAPFDHPLPDRPTFARDVPFEAASLGAVRRLVYRSAAQAGLHTARRHDLVLAVSEVAANSIRHGGGEGVLRIWEEADTVVCEVQDAGRIDEPLAGRERPAIGQQDGRGLWIANQLCELVQVRSFATGTTVRLHMRRV
jgi:anti-sigma regulatory factor (Ser/Thr protein kinase)